MISSAHPARTDGFPDDVVQAAVRALRVLPTRTPIFGVSGVQGSGKSTLAAQMASALRTDGLRVAVLSLDDLYLPREARRQLGEHVHPLLVTRGPPGTHDVALGCALLDRLRAGESVALPRFDKLADDRAPARDWETAGPRLDAVIVEGWCLGVPAEADAALAHPINALERDADRDGAWRRHCNDALRRDYPALWSRLDALWFLQPPGFGIVAQWRWQQEQALARAHGRSPSMDEAGVLHFVQFFERVSRQALRTLPAIADATLELDTRRRMIELHARAGVARKPGPFADNTGA